MKILPRRIFNHMQEALRLLADGRSRVVLHAIRTRLRSDTVALGLRRDLTVPFKAPPAKLPLLVRPLEPADDLSMLNVDMADVAPDLVPARLAQRRLVEANIPTCWVAIAPDGKVCYMQWLIAPRENDRILAQWSDLFPQLSPDEALLEGAYTDAAYRGQGIMPHAMARIAEQAQAFGARWVNTFVGVGNVASLKGCKKAGFVPYVKRGESWRLLQRGVHFAPLPEGTQYPFD